MAKKGVVKQEKAIDAEASIASEDENFEEIFSGLESESE